MSRIRLSSRVPFRLLALGIATISLVAPAHARPSGAITPHDAVSDAAGDDQAAAGAQVAPGIEDRSTPRRPAPGVATFGRPQRVSAGDAIVPPRDYAKGTAEPKPSDYDPNESGTIYDIAFMGISAGTLMFELRGYSIADLAFPATAQEVTFPEGTTELEIGDLTITVIAASATSLEYKVRLGTRD